MKIVVTSKKLKPDKEVLVMNESMNDIHGKDFSKFVRRVIRKKLESSSFQFKSFCFFKKCLDFNKCLISLVSLVMFVVGFAVFPSTFSEVAHGQTVVNRYPPARGFFVRRDANSVARDDIILHKVGTSKIYAVMQNDYMPGNRLYVHTAANKHGTLQEYSRHLGVPFVPSQVIHYASNGTKGTDYGTYYTWKYVPHYDYSNLANITIFVGDSDGMESAGNPCQQGIPSSSVGLPVNVLTGNMWLEQTDYSVVGSGGALDLNRFYNTVIQTDGLFGKGWRTQFDESLEAYGDSLVRVKMADGRAVYLGRRDTTSAYNLSPQKYIGEVLKEADGSYRLKLKDGHESKFTAAGRLEWKKDRNGNQTTLTYRKVETTCIIFNIYCYISYAES